MADNVPFNSLDPLGPEFGDINRPILDEKGLAPFEGEVYKDPKINFPSPDKYFPVFAGPQNLNRPNRSINQDVVRTNAVNPSIPRRPYSPNRNKSLHGYLDAMMQANQNKNNFGKIFSYNAGPDGNAFYKRYAAYGQEKFDQIGFSPLRDNEANFNARTTRWDDFSRMMSYSFVPLLTSGFVSGPKSLAKMLKGDFTSADLEDAKLYEEAAAIGQSTKGGVFGFVNNATMNFGYTAGIILEAIAEEAAGALLAAPTGGASLFAATANNAMKASKIGKSLFNGFKAVKNTLSEVNTFTGARRFWEAASSSKTLTSVARGLNPLENTMDAFKAIRQADNFTDLALLSKTAGGFYRDVRNINMALSEARLEAGMVENHMYDQLYMKAFQAKGEVPTNEELAAIEKQAKDASYDTLMKNAGLIYASNAITFNNITGPKGGLRNFIKGTTEDVYRMSSKQGAKNFGSIGKVVYDRSAKAFTIQKDNFIQYAKNWYKQPVYKSLKSTVGYFKANFTEGIQENLQEVIAGANERYYMDSYKSPALSAQMYSRGAMGMINKTKNDYYREELGKQISGQGAETFASGFFMGALAGPLNNAVPFLSTGYNRMFDKEAFNKWKTEQTAIATNLVTELNGMDLKTFMSDKNLNLGAQDLISKIKQRGSKKEALDAETEAYVSQVVLMRQSGTTDLIKEKLKSFSQATDEEFADAFGIEKEQVEKYRGRVDMAVERLDRVNNLYTKYQRKYPNPISDSDLADKSAPDYEEKVEFQKAWNINIHNMVFFNEVYDNAKERREQIKNKYSNNPNFKSLGSNEKSLLFAPERLGEEITILKQDIQLEKEGSNRPEVVKKLEQKLGLYEDFKSNHLKFDQFFNRAEYSNALQEVLTKELGREATAEEIDAKFTELYGDIDDKEIGAYIIGDLKKSHDNFLKTLAIQNDDTIFDETTNEAFEALKDYYKLGHEAKSITKYINLMDDPESFKDLVRRNQTWIKNFNAKRVKYFEDLIKNEMGKVRDNAFLNTLADNGYYLNEEDMVNYLGDKNIPPSEIYNYITKEVYPINSEKYKEIYAEFFSKRADLKAQQNAKKTNIVKNSYEKKIQDLRDLMEQEIANLPTTQVKVLGEAITMKNKTISAKEIAAQLNNEEYVEAGYEDAVEPMVFYKDADGQLLYDSPEGEPVDFADIKIKFTEATKFSFDAVPDAEKVTEITKRYEDQIAEVQKAYTEDLEVIEDEEMYEEVTQDTDLSTPDLIEFRNGLYSTFIEEYLPTLSEDEQMAISEDETLEDIKFEEWYKKPENKKYFDEYNNKNRPEKSPDNITFTFEGKDLNTKDASLEELIKYRDILNTSIENLEDMSDPDDDERLRLLKVDLKNINSIIQKRQFAKFSPVVKEGVKKIQKLLNAQKGVEERYLLTEDDPDTGLKAGEIAYRVNGKIHRRVTKALQQVLGKDYVYKGIAKVNSAFDLTIGKQGLNTDSIDDFISQLKGLLSTKAPGYDPLPGVNIGLLDDLKTQLKKLTGLSKEQIDIEKTKDKLLAQLDNKLKDLLKAQKDGNETRISNLTQQRQTIIDELKNLDAKSKSLTNTSSTKTETQKEEIEKKQRVADIITTQLDLGIELPKILDTLAEQGYVEKINNSAFFKQSTNRDAIVFNIDGIIVPIYRSSQGTSSKTKGEWYPFFFNAGDWLVKGGADTYKDGYNNPIIKQILDTLNKNYKYDKPIAKVDGDNQQLLSLFGFENLDVSPENNYGIYDYQNYASIGIILKYWQRNLGNIDISGYQDYLNGASLNLIKTNPALKSEIERAFKGVSDIFKEINILKQNTEVTDNEILVPNTTKDIVKNFFTENTYQDGRDAGNFVDDAKDYLETGVAPKFDPSKITQEAYDKLFDPSTGYLTQLKRKVDSGEFYLIGRDLVVYDSNIMRPDGSIDRIAGEIDLLLATDDGIMIVDIKSGESNKWFNFNKLSKEGKPIYSKREEYTLQQGAYATMLEKMINAPVAGIALLPIERISDKDTNLIVDAGKPESKDVYSNLEYEKDKDGNLVKNAMNETVFKSTGKAYSNFFIPLYRDSVKDKLDMLFPQSSAKVIPGLTSVGQNQFKIFKERLEQISDANTPENRKAVEAIELEMGQFLSNNPIEVPEDLTALLNAKKAVFDRADLNTLITNTLKRYQGQADINSKKMADLTKRVSEVKIDMNFDGIDLSETSDFVNEQLDKDSDFKFRYEVHEKYFENKYGDATPGQISAINNLSSTGVITNAELNEFNNSEKSKEEASLLIHEAVKRIQYLVANTEDTAEAKSLKIYQKDIISLMFYTKNTTAINKFISTLNSVKESVEDDNLNNAVSELNVEILNLDSGLSSPYIKENAKKDLETKLADIQKIKDAITSLPNFIDAETEITIEAEEEEGVVEEFDFDFTAANNVQEGDVFHSKSGNFAKYTVSKVNKDNSVELKDENNNPIEVSMAELNDNYLTQDEILSMEPENITDNVTPAENDISQENLTAVDRFIDNKTQIIQVEEDATKKTLKQLDDELLENLDC